MSGKYEIISFNTNKKDIQKHNWLSKFVAIMQNHNDNNPDIIITQEFNHNSNLNQVVTSLSGKWDYFPKNTPNKNFEALFYRTDKFSNITDLTTSFILKIQCVKLTFANDENQSIIVVNVHLTDKLKKSHNNILECIKDKCNSLENSHNCGIIIGGDFNEGVRKLKETWEESKPLESRNWTVDGGYECENSKDYGLQTMFNSDNPWDHFITNKHLKTSEFNYALNFKSSQQSSVSIDGNDYAWYKDFPTLLYTKISDHAPIKMKFTFA